LLAFFCIRELELRHDELALCRGDHLELVPDLGRDLPLDLRELSPGSSRPCSGFLDAALTLLEALFCLSQLGD
jgi:hypothetical protein